MRGDGPSKVVPVAVVLVAVLLAGCYTGPDLEGPRNGKIVAEHVNETPANATFVPYSDVDLETVRVAVRNASQDPNEFGETSFRKSDWRRFNRSDLGNKLVENEEVYVRYSGRVFYVYTLVGR